MEPQASREEHERLMTPYEASRALRRDPKTVWRWARAGRLRRVMTPGGTGRYYEADVRAIVDGSR